MSRNLKNAFNDDYDLDEHGNPVRTVSPEPVEYDDDDLDIDLAFNCTHVNWDKRACTGFVTFEASQQSGECSTCRTEYDREGNQLTDWYFIEDVSDYVSDYVDDFYRDRDDEERELRLIR